MYIYIHVLYKIIGRYKSFDNKYRDICVIYLRNLFGMIIFSNFFFFFLFLENSFSYCASYMRAIIFILFDRYESK